MNGTRLSIVGGMIIIAALSRLLPHPPNFTAVAAIGLFAGRAMGGRLLKFAIPFLALLLSDILLNNWLYGSYYSSFTIFREGFIWVYAPMLLMVGLAPLLVKKVRALPVLGASVVASALFFIVSNFGTWLTGVMYPKTISGLIACYTAAIPFFWNTLFGTVVYASLFFTAYKLAEKHVPAFSKA